MAEAATPKVVLIVMENKPYAKIVGSTSAPYMNSMITQGKLFTDYHAIVAGSVHDYRAMTAGLTERVDPLPDNVFHSIDQTQLTWRSFQESMGGNCGVPTSETVPGTTKALYSRGHDAAYLYKGNESCEGNDVPLTFDALANLPDFSVIIPNICDDMHTFPTGGTCPAFFGDVSGSNARVIGDAWLQHVVPTILMADSNTTVIVTFDEGTTNSGERVYAVEVGAGVSSGTTDTTHYDHYGLLAGIYQTFGLGIAPNNASTATPLPILPTETLSVTAYGPGRGSVTSSPAGIDCASPCSSASAAFGYGQSVTLTATPDDAAGTVSWSGCDNATGTDMTCTVAMSRDQSVSVTFT